MDKSAKFLNFENNVEKIIIISDWNTEKINDVLFKCYVVEEDGEEVDKFWYVWDYDLAESLKKFIRGKKPYEKIKIKVLMTEVDEFSKEYKLSKSD